jgi:non-specific protein-tyrosine kinase
MGVLTTTDILGAPLQEGTLELRSQLAVVRRRFGLILTTLIGCIFATALVTGVMTPTYQGEATLLIGNTTGSVTPSLDQALLSQRLSVTYANVATQRATLQRVMDKLGIKTPMEEFAKLVSASAPTESSVVIITAKDHDPGRAAAIANAIANDLIASAPAITGRDPAIHTFIHESLTRTQDQLAQTQAQADELSAKVGRTPAEDARLAALQTRLANLQTTFSALLGLASNASANQATLTDPAVPSTEPVSPNPPVNLALGAVGGLLLGLLVAFVIEQFDDSVRTADEVAVVTGLPTLGTIGRERINRRGLKLYWLTALLRPRSPIAEAYRTLRTNLEFAMVDTPARSILVTSPVPGDGKTTVAANLAVALAQAGRRTILVDADLRRPTIAEVFGIQSPGLTDLVTRHRTAADFLVATEQPNLRVLVSGPVPPNPGELLATQWFRRMLDSLTEAADVVVLDSAPLVLVADAAVVAAQVDATLLVVRAGTTRKDAILRSVDALRQAGARVLGVALNDVKGTTSELYEAYIGSDRVNAPADPSTSTLPPGSRPVDTRGASTVR